MDLKELEQYRIQLFRDASGMKKQPDRIPHVSFYVTWKILDSGYKLTDAMSDYEIMEKVVRQHQEKYQFDQIFDLGTRNAYMLSQALGSDSYVVDDENEVVNFKDDAYCNIDELEAFSKDYKKFVWEVGMARKFDFWGEHTDLSTIQKALEERNRFFQFFGRMRGIMRDEYGIPGNGAPNPYATLSIETMFGFVLGMKNMALAMRRSKGQLHDALEALDELYFYPNLKKLEQMPDGPNMSYCYDYIIASLAHNFMNLKQWEEFYWPYLKQVLDVLVKKNMTCVLFMEGSMLRFKDYFQDYPKGSIIILPENDNVFDIRKQLPNVAIMGGMSNELLGSGTKEQCVDLAKRLIDELGRDGGYMMCQDKMGSFRRDGNPENLKAVSDYILNHSF